MVVNDSYASTMVQSNVWTKPTYAVDVGNGWKWTISNSRWFTYRKWWLSASLLVRKVTDSTIGASGQGEKARSETQCAHETNDVDGTCRADLLAELLAVHVDTFFYCFFEKKCVTWYPLVNEHSYGSHGHWIFVPFPSSMVVIQFADLTWCHLEHCEVFCEVDKKSN